MLVKKGSLLRLSNRPVFISTTLKILRPSTLQVFIFSAISCKKPYDQHDRVNESLKNVILLFMNIKVGQGSG